MIQRKHYLKAMEILERDGWCQRAMESVGGEHCVLGALTRAAHPRTSPDTFRFQAWLLNDQFHERELGPLSFNDAPETTYEDVLTFLALGAAGAFE